MVCGMSQDEAGVEEAHVGLKNKYFTTTVGWRERRSRFIMIMLTQRVLEKEGLYLFMLNRSLIEHFHDPEFNEHDRRSIVDFFVAQGRRNQGPGELLRDSVDVEEYAIWERMIRRGA